MEGKEGGERAKGGNGKFFPLSLLLL